MLPRFVHLHLHTEYSVSDGIVRLKELLQRTVSLGMPAVAITDLNNFFAAVKFYRAARSLGIKPIIGVEVLVADAEDEENPSHLVLLCQNNAGYKRAIDLVSRGFLHSQGLPVITREEIKENSEGLLAIACAHKSDISEAIKRGNFDLARQHLLFWNEVFPGRFYIELCRTDKRDEEVYISNILVLASELEIPVVATNDVRFLDADDFGAHEARVCINQGVVLEDSKRPRDYSVKQYFRSPDEMLELFSDLPEAIQNGIEIAKRCNLEIQIGETFLPIFPMPEDANCEVEEYFVLEAKKGLKERFKTIFRDGEHPKDSVEEYEKRLDYEIGIIRQMGFPSYFIIVADFINWSKRHDIPVGPGRGSGAGSLVAYALKITDLDPLAHDLLFERFLNPERVSMPDFDVDFCMEGRDKVIEYVVHRYGKEKVSQIITYGTMAARAVVRDVGRVLGYPYGFVDKIAKLIPFALGMTLTEAMRQEEQLKDRYDNDEEVKVLMNLALKLEGITRNLGKHAGGVVISPSKLTDFTALYCEAGDPDHVVTQYDKDDLEKIGLVKFDFLGLRTLTIIDWAVKAINAKLAKRGEEPIDIAHIPLDDPKTFELLQSSATSAVFQLESRGMQELVKKLQPDSFADIVVLVALYRPGPLQSGMVDDYVNRKHGRAQVVYLHPVLEPVLQPTYGVILYQEQVMQIAQVMAGYTLGGADLLRRAMGKKKVEEMAKQRTIFLEGAEKKSIDKKIANDVFDLMEFFSGYGFNKSHSAGYALVSYQTAWLKAHHPAEFMAAVLSSDMDNTEKVVKFLVECKDLGLTVIPPHINVSEYKFTVNENGEVVFGLGAIKGVGLAALESILQCRTEDGEFKDLFSFCKRVERGKLNRKVLEALIRSGALDGLRPNRASMFASIDQAFLVADQNQRNKASGQYSLFAALDDDVDDKEESAATEVPYVAQFEWQQSELLSGEKATLGFYLSGHPFDRYRPEIKKMVSLSIAELAEVNGQVVTVAGLLSSMRTLLTKSNKKLGIVTLEDSTSNIDAILFSDVLLESSDDLILDTVVFIEGEVNYDDFSGGQRIRAKRVMSLDKARNAYAKYLMLQLDKSVSNADLFKELAKLIAEKRGENGNCPIYISYLGDDANAKLALGDDWKVWLSVDLITALRAKLGEENVWVGY